ncbi:MAG: hypothetical protein HY686_07615 [Chloroflexi bacterium]|nr:hypothetical protein [Chloroflexota bacterium]
MKVSIGVKGIAGGLVAGLFSFFLLVLSPALGPALDHHLAERHPFHGHMYLGASYEHSHAAYLPHRHSHVLVEKAPTPEGCAAGVVCLNPVQGDQLTACGIASSPCTRQDVGLTTNVSLNQFPIGQPGSVLPSAIPSRPFRPPPVA